MNTYSSDAKKAIYTQKSFYKSPEDYIHTAEDKF